MLGRVVKTMGGGDIHKMGVPRAAGVFQEGKLGGHLGKSVITVR